MRPHLERAVALDPRSSESVDRIETVSSEQVTAFRLARHHLDRRASRRRLVHVVRGLVGVQAQVSSAAFISLWTRVEGLSPSEIEAAVYRTKRLTRTWCLRGTVHLLSSEDQAWIPATLGPEAGGIGPWLRRRGLTPAKHRKLLQAVLGALADGPLSRAEVADRVAAEMSGTGAHFGSWGGVLRLFAQQGLLVFGPPRGQETTFVRADRWWPERGARVGHGLIAKRPSAHVRPDRPSDPKLEARARADRSCDPKLEAELIRRYLRTYGPATWADLAYWSGLSATRFRRGLDLLRGELAAVKLEGSAPGRTHWILREDLSRLRRAAHREKSPSARLLPSFDAFLLGHRDKSLLFGAAHYKSVFRKAGWISPTLLVDGRVAGLWSCRRGGGKSLEVTLSPFARLSPATRRALAAEAASLSRFLIGSEARLSLRVD